MHSKTSNYLTHNNSLKKCSLGRCRVASQSEIYRPSGSKECAREQKMRQKCSQPDLARWKGFIVTCVISRARTASARCSFDTFITAFPQYRGCWAICKPVLCTFVLSGALNSASSHPTLFLSICFAGELLFDCRF